MDNVTHTLVSALAGDALAHTTPTRIGGLPADARRSLLVTSMAIGGNLPDLDFLYTSLIGGKLEYLLHHRGHTHTILGALIASVVLWGAMHAWLRFRRLKPARVDHLVIGGVALLAPLLHIAMDFTNNYGVHPFWPWRNDWFYGDSVFIIEPLLWAACAPLALTLRTVAARLAVGFVLIAGVALSLFTGLVPIASTLLLAAIALGLLLVARRAPPRAALLSGVAVWLIVTATFVGASRIAEARALALAAQTHPGDTLHEAILTPSPANPLCWDVILVQSGAEHIALRRAMLSLAPGLLQAEGCPTRSLGVPITAPITAVEASDRADAKWYGQSIYLRQALIDVAASDCRAAALMQFARAPWLAATDRALVLGDLRYDREPALSFAEIDLSERPIACPTPLPPWRRPRADLLQ